MASRRRAGAQSRSLARTMSALRVFFRWLEAQEITRNRSLLQVAMPKVPHGIPKPLTVEKAAAVMDGGAGAELDWVMARDAAVLLLLTARACASPRRWGCCARTRRSTAATCCASPARAARS